MNQISSIFSQLLQLFPCLEFNKWGKRPNAECHDRGVHLLESFVDMLFRQLGWTHFLREINGEFQSCEGLKHLGIISPPFRLLLIRMRIASESSISISSSS